MVIKFPVCCQSPIKPLFEIEMPKRLQLRFFFITGLLALLMSIACDDTDRLAEAGWNSPQI